MLNTIEEFDGEESVAKTTNISHFDDGTSFSSKTMQNPLLVCAASEYVRNPMKQHLFHYPSFYKSGRSLLCDLHGLFQEHDKQLSFFAFLCRPPFANETTSATIEQMFFIATHRHEYDPREKIGAVESAQQTTEAAPEQVYGHIFSFNHTIIQCQTHPQLERHQYHTRLAKAHQPWHSSYRLPASCAHKPL